MGLLGVSDLARSSEFLRRLEAAAATVGGLPENVSPEAWAVNNALYVSARLSGANVDDEALIAEVEKAL